MSDNPSNVDVEGQIDAGFTSYFDPDKHGNGKTVGGSSPDDDGDESTSTWPSAATPRSELNKDQIRVIEAAANPVTDYESCKELSDDVVPERSKDYANQVLLAHWSEKQDSLKDTSMAGGHPAAVDAEQIAELRRQLVSGASLKNIVDEFPLSIGAASYYARGKRVPVPESEIDHPPVKYHSGNHQWVIDNNSSNTPAQTQLDAEMGTCDDVADGGTGADAATAKTATFSESSGTETTPRTASAARMTTRTTSSNKSWFLIALAFFGGWTFRSLFGGDGDD